MAASPAPPSCGAPMHGKPGRANHQLEFRTTGDAMVNDHTALSCSKCVANPAAVAVPLKHGFPQPAKVLLVLTPEGVAGRAHAVR